VGIGEFIGESMGNSPAAARDAVISAIGLPAASAYFIIALRYLTPGNPSMPVPALIPFCLNQPALISSA
jgi:hypothetical protein